MTSTENVAERVLKLREEKEISQQVLADNLQITRQSLSLYEKAERTMNIELLTKIAQYFEVSTDYLLGLTDVKTTEQDMKTACEVTGLSEKAIEMLSNRDILAYNCGDTDNPARVYSEVLNKILSDGSFYGIVYNYAHLYDASKKILSSGCFLKSSTILTFSENMTKEEGEILVDANKRFHEDGWNEKEKDCDVCRYLCINLIEALSDTFDNRNKIDDFTKEQLIEYYEKGKGTE